MTRRSVEELWNGLAKRLRFSLCCAYPLDVLSNDAEGAAFNRVCAEHSRVIPAESYTALPGPDERLSHVSHLQQKAKILETETAVRAENEYALIRVEDNGIGIPAGFLPRVFDLFAQGESGSDRSRGGLGIGLTLVQRLVELHGGTVEAASEGYGRGSVFSVRLARIAEQESTMVFANPAANSDAARRILIIEDQDDAREALRTALGLLGHETFESQGGQNSVELALALQPDVALIDIGLPDLDGYELARRIRSASQGHNILLIALTGYDQMDDRRRAYEAGFDMHLVKPLDLGQLTGILSTARRSTTAAGVESARA